MADKLCPQEATEAMVDGDVRWVIAWLNSSGNSSGASLHRHLKATGTWSPEVSNYVADENHAPTKGALAALLWFLMWRKA